MRAPFNVTGYKYLESQTKRWGTNTIVADAEANFADMDVVALVTQFNQEKEFQTDFEAQAATGDSGGAMFFRNEDEWELSGIMIAAGLGASEQPADTAVFRNFTIFADLSEYRNQIDSIISSLQLQPGDANRDLAFDQFDIVTVAQANKYLSGQAATWGEGDWNGGPGGSVESPPPGDASFDQKDIIAALSTGLYLAGSYAAKDASAIDRTTFSGGNTTFTTTADITNLPNIGDDGTALVRFTNLRRPQATTSADLSNIDTEQIVAIPEPSTTRLLVTAVVFLLLISRMCGFNSLIRKENLHSR